MCAPARSVLHLDVAAHKSASTGPASSASRPPCVGRELSCSPTRTPGRRAQGRQVPQAMLARSINSTDPSRTQRARRQRHHDLSPCATPIKRAGAVHLTAVIVAKSRFPPHRCAPHPHPQPTRLLERPRRQSELHRHRRVQRVTRRREHRVDPVTRRLDDVTAAGLHRAAEDRVVRRQCCLHRFRVLVPQARRTLHIGEQERDRPRRQLRHPDPLRSAAPERQVNQTNRTRAAAAEPPGNVPASQRPATGGQGAPERSPSGSRSIPCKCRSGRARAARRQCANNRIEADAWA